MGDPLYRNFGLKAASFGIPTATAVAVTFTDTGDLVTHNAHGKSNGTVVVLQTIVTTTGATAFVRYYMIAATTNTYQLSATYGGGAVVLTTDGTGTVKYITPSAVYLPNKWALTPKKKEFTYAGGDQEIDQSQVLGYNGQLDVDCIPLATHMALFGLSAQTTALPDGYTSLVYGGTVTERSGTVCEFWTEGTATRRDASTGAETNVYVRRTYYVCRVSGVTPGGQNTGDKAEVESYFIAASSTVVDIIGGALPATVPSGGVFFSTMEKAVS